MNDKSALRALLIRHETERMSTRLAHAVQSEAKSLKQRLKRAPKLSQVRALANALAPQGGDDQPAHRLARLHELVVNQLQRTAEQVPLPQLEPEWPADDLPNSFWPYLSARLLGLQTQKMQQPGLSEQVWNNVCTNYTRGLTWSAAPPAATLAALHLHLAETVIYQFIETWEYSEGKEAAT